MEEVHMLTTIDNPYNPFTQPDEWYALDRYLGHYTPEYLARIVVISDALSPADQDVAMEMAIDEIVAYNLNGLYCKVTEKNFDKLVGSRFKNGESIEQIES